MPLHVSSTVCSSLGGQNCVIHVGGRPLHRSSRNLCKGRPPTGVIIPDAVQYNFDLTMSTTVLETCRGI